MSTAMDSNPGGQGTPPDPSIYLRVQRGFAYEWYVINSKTPEEDKLVSPFLPKPPKHLWDSGCGVIGSTIYVVGGDDDGPLQDDVYYIDTRRPSDGWKKGCPMKKTRHNPFPVTVDGKLYVLGKNGEVFDERKSCWTALREANLFPIENFFPIVTGGHAVLDKNNGNKILFHCKIFPDLYYYDIELDSWGTFSKSNLGIGKKTSALVDGILYCLDYWKAGFMFGLDISNPKNELQIVLGFENKNIKEKKPLPQPGPESSPGPESFLVSLGSSKLAVIWAGVIAHPPGKPRSTDKEPKLLVSCAILNMSKQPNPTTGGVDFVAETLSVSYYNVLGSCLINCLPVFSTVPEHEADRKAPKLKMEVNKSGDEVVEDTSDEVTDSGQDEVVIHRGKIRKLTEDNAEKDRIISELRRENNLKNAKISDLRRKITKHPKTTTPGFGFESISAQFDKDHLEHENLTLQIGGMLIEKDIAEEKPEVAGDIIDDFVTHSVTQTYQIGEDVGKKESKATEEDARGEKQEMENVDEEEEDDEGAEEEEWGVLDSLTRGVLPFTRMVNVYTDLTTSRVPLIRLLPYADVILLRQIVRSIDADLNLIVWTNDVTREVVTLNDIMKLLQGGNVSNLMIDGLTRMLTIQMDKYNLKHGNVAYFPCTIRTILPTKDKVMREVLLDEKLHHVFENVRQHGTKYYRYLVFPMNGSRHKPLKITPCHWTVLLFDIRKKNWMHYNSLRTRDGRDLLLKDATFVKKYVENYMKDRHAELKNQSTGTQMLFEEQNFDAPICSSQRAPQQENTSVDCGVIVCMLMEVLAHHKPIPKTLPKIEIDQYRAGLVSLFLNDEGNDQMLKIWQAEQARRMEPDELYGWLCELW